MQQPMTQPVTAEKNHRRRGSFLRIMRGYLMLVGAATTAYALVRLVVLLLVAASGLTPID